ncbi:hypothetical protein ScPMuIL_014778 [Solemya velum]
MTSLQNIKAAVGGLHIQNATLTTVTLCVLDIRRFMLDPQFSTQTGMKGSLFLVDGYEMTIRDRNYKQKVVLSPGLANLVQRKQLQIGSQIKLTECDLHYDETDLCGNSIVIVKNLTILKENDFQTFNAAHSLQWCPDGSSKEKENQPVVSSRGYYVSLWSTAEMSGDLWNKEVQMSGSLGDISVDDLYTVKEVSKNWMSIRSAQPAVLVTVLQKSRIIHYAKPSKDDKWPFQVHLRVGDESGACRVVIWNALCPQLFNSIHEQSILLLRNFTVKKSFMVSDEKSRIPPSTKIFGIDINLNSHHPVANVKIMDPAAVQQDVTLINANYSLVTRHSLGLLPDDIICDVAGLVTYIGRYEREPMQTKHGPDSGGFWIKRWIFLHDKTKNKPIILQLYRAAQVGVIDALKPGDILLCCHMRVVQGSGELIHSIVQRTVYLTSTAETQLTVLNNNSLNRCKRLLDEPIIKQIISWSKSQAAKNYVTEAVVGGYFHYPPLPLSLADFTRLNPSFQITESKEWKNVLESLSYREKRRLFIQAILSSLEACSDTSVPRQATRSSKRLRRTLPLEDQNVSSDILETIPGSSFLHGTGPSAIAFDADSWDEVQGSLVFCDNVDDRQTPGDMHDSLSKDCGFISLFWSGLNSKVTLKTLKPCGTDQGHSFLELVNKDMLPGECSTHLNKSVIDAILSSANDFVGKRFLVVLDCYSHGPDIKEVIVNRAYFLDQ